MVPFSNSSQTNDLQSTVKLREQSYSYLLSMFDRPHHRQTTEPRLPYACMVLHICIYHNLAICTEGSPVRACKRTKWEACSHLPNLALTTYLHSQLRSYMYLSPGQEEFLASMQLQPAYLGVCGCVCLEEKIPFYNQKGDDLSKLKLSNFRPANSSSSTIKDQYPLLPPDLVSIQLMQFSFLFLYTVCPTTLVLLKKIHCHTHQENCAMIGRDFTNWLDHWSPNRKTTLITCSPPATE